MHIRNHIFIFNNLGTPLIFLTTPLGGRVALRASWSTTNNVIKFKDLID